jgi:prolyl oligopeptidase
MAARMLEQGHDILYYENIEGGHGGAADSEQEAYLVTLSYEFLAKELGPFDSSAATRSSPIRRRESSGPDHGRDR